MKLLDKNNISNVPQNDNGRLNISNIYGSNDSEKTKFNNKSSLNKNEIDREKIMNDIAFITDTVIIKTNVEIKKNEWI